MIDKLQIYPAPAADEAAAIAAALSILIAQRDANAQGALHRAALRYQDVANGDVSRHFGWRDTARLEALNV